MKKNIRKAIVMALALMMAMTAVAQADTIISPVFRLPGAASRPTEVPTVEPTAEPTVEPTAEPTAEPVVEVTAEPTVEPTVEPIAEPMVEVTAEPTVEPTIEPTVEPTVEPTAEPTEVPTAEPTAEPTPEPLPEITVDVVSNLAGKAYVFAGTELVLTAVIEGAEGYDYTLQWQQSNDDGATWQDIAGANGMSYSLVLGTEHNGISWRVTVDLIDPNSAE